MVKDRTGATTSGFNRPTPPLALLYAGPREENGATCINLLLLVRVYDGI